MAPAGVRPAGHRDALSTNQGIYPADPDGRLRPGQTVRNLKGPLPDRPGTVKADRPKAGPTGSPAGQARKNPPDPGGKRGNFQPGAGRNPGPPRGRISVHAAPGRSQALVSKRVRRRAYYHKPRNKPSVPKGGILSDGRAGRRVPPVGIHWQRFVPPGAAEALGRSVAHSQPAFRGGS